MKFFNIVISFVFLLPTPFNLYANEQQNTSNIQLESEYMQEPTITLGCQPIPDCLTELDILSFLNLLSNKQSEAEQTQN